MVRAGSWVPGLHSGGLQADNVLTGAEGLMLGVCGCMVPSSGPSSCEACCKGCALLLGPDNLIHTILLQLLHARMHAPMVLHGLNAARSAVRNAKCLACHASTCMLPHNPQPIWLL